MIKDYFRLTSNEYMPGTIEEPKLSCEKCSWQVDFTKPKQSILCSHVCEIPYWTTTEEHEIIRTDVLEILDRKVVQKHFWICEVGFADGSSKSRFVYLSAKKPTRVVQRSTINFLFKCDLCNNPTVRGISDTYVLSRDVSEELPIYNTNRGIIVSSNIAQKILKRRLNGLEVVRVTVRDAPEDGLPVDLFGKARQEGG